MRLLVIYPSGRQLIIVGVWKGPGNIKGTNVLLVISDREQKMGEETIHPNAAMVLDPRGVVVDADFGTVLYNPRLCSDGMEKWVLDWLNKHPEYPDNVIQKILRSNSN